MAQSSCGHTGSGQENMALEAQIDTGSTSLLQYMSFTFPPTSANQICTLAATFPFFESQYLGWSFSSPVPPALDIFLISPLSDSSSIIPPTWTSTYFPTNSAPAQYFGTLTPIVRLDTTANSIPCPENSVLSFVFRFAEVVVGDKAVDDVWSQYPAGLSGGFPMTGVYMTVC
ncbi:hypothetical protein OCU04_006035 [Sclerotinia nivalis]|uniref:Ubiquitin 3 binding protein But2 C-terminal domain-containing protein n=1 Tax=Sclerotinia nivalis TaxID=352851 RepID=A0A9X0AM54_9HELO|nr:hypothetical protein OCU04_006035 [Sclerotinia nivalis]